MKKIKKRIKKTKVNWFNAFILVSAIGCALLLIHDFIVWGIVPFFTRDYIQLTYTGMFVDLFTFFGLEMAMQILEDN